MILLTKIPSWLRTFSQVGCDCLFSALQNEEIMQTYINLFSFIKEIHGLSRFMLRKGGGGERGKESKVQIAVKLKRYKKKKATFDGSTRSLYQVTFHNKPHTDEYSSIISEYNAYNTHVILYSTLVYNVTA